MTRRLAALLAALLFWLAAPLAGSAPAQAAATYAICSNQTYALCAAAKAFVYQDVSYAKCLIKKGNSISAPPLYYTSLLQVKDICDINAEGVGNGYMMSTFSLPEDVKKGGKKALYTCPGGSTGDYAQCDGGTCFRSTSGQVFPGIGKVAANEIVCSCPITHTTTSTAPFGYQFIDAYPCRKEAFDVCRQDADNGSIIPVGSPPGAGRLLTNKLYGQNYEINECFLK